MAIKRYRSKRCFTRQKTAGPLVVYERAIQEELPQAPGQHGRQVSLFKSKKGEEG